jgi:hypothetical protein
MKKVLLETNRSGYATDQIENTLTVGEVIEMLKDFDEDTPVYFSNDNGYTYGGLDWECIREEEK